MLSSQFKFSANKTDGQTDKRTPVKQYAPDLSMQGGIKKLEALKYLYRSTGLIFL